MSKTEEILYKAYTKGIFNETMSIAEQLKTEQPRLEPSDRFELAYEQAKKNSKL